MNFIHTVNVRVQEMLDESTDVMSVSDEPDIHYRYEQKLIADELTADLRQQVEDRDQDIDELKQQLQRSNDERQQLIQRLKNAENQVYTSSTSHSDFRNFMQKSIASQNMANLSVFPLPYRVQ